MAEPTEGRRCWTCQTDHDLDEACPRSGVAVSAAAAGEPMKFARRPPAITAAHHGRDACCGEGIWPGERIRSGNGGWVHANGECDA